MLVGPEAGRTSIDWRWAIESEYLTPISRTTLTDEIVNRLTGLILDTGLRPGDKLPSERELMSKLSVSRSSLREAIRALSAVGALEVSVREGTFVGHGGVSLLRGPLFWRLLLGERNLPDVTEARRTVEVAAAGLAALRATPEEIEVITRVVEKMRATLDDVTAYSGHDLDFHLAVAAAAHNAVLYQILDTLRHVIRAWIGKNILDTGGEPVSFSEHISILEAVKARDPEAARRAMEEHLDRAAARIVAGLSASRSAAQPERSLKATEVHS